MTEIASVAAEIEIMSNCEQLLHYLGLIEANTRTPGAGDTEQGQQGIWTVETKGTTRWYTTDVIFTGSAQNVELVFDRDVMILTIDQEFSSANAKDSTITKATPPYSVNTILSESLANVDTSIFLQLGIEYRWRGNTKMNVAYANTTASDTVRIRVTVDII